MPFEFSSEALSVTHENDVAGGIAWPVQRSKRSVTSSGDTGGGFFTRLTRADDPKSCRNEIPSKPITRPVTVPVPAKRTLAGG